MYYALCKSLCCGHEFASRKMVMKVKMTEKVSLLVKQINMIGFYLWINHIQSFTSRSPIVKTKSE